MAKSILSVIPGVGSDKAWTTFHALRTPELMPIGVALAENADAILHMLTLPFQLLTVGTAGMKEVFRLSNEALDSTAKTLEVLNDAVGQRLQAGAQRLVEKEKSIDPVEQAARLLAGLLASDQQLRAAAHALLFASVSYGWAALECAAKDIWVTALNLRPQQLAPSTLSNLPDGTAGEGLSGKQIAVGLLARHGFDLRNVLGTLLAPKFDFTGVSGLRVAYAAAFGKGGPTEQALLEPKLAITEATRHLIVHRAGLVDEEYRRRTGEDAPLDMRLELDSERVCDLVSVAVLAGCALLTAVDQWLLANPTPSPTA